MYVHSKAGFETIMILHIWLEHMCVGQEVLAQ